MYTIMCYIIRFSYLKVAYLVLNMFDFVEKLILFFKSKHSRELTPIPAQ